MFLFNLSLGEFLTIFTALSSLTVLLYLLDRSRRKQVVATLRFWRDSEIPSQRKHRRKIQQPLSLILQLAGMALLLLAIAQLRLGSPDQSSRDHVLLVDASAWMQANTTGSRRLIDEARASARRYIRALPSLDRVMLVRADAMATPLTSFESNKAKLDSTLAAIEPGGNALNLTQAFDFAQQALRLEGKRAGEIVYAGPGRVAQEEITEGLKPPANLRLLLTEGQPENAGIRKVSLRRAPRDPEVWEVFVTARNYGTRPRVLPITVSFGGAPVATRKLTAAPGREEQVNFNFRTKAAGWLEARIEGKDALTTDDYATIELPGEKSMRVTVYSPEPESFRALLSANPRIETVLRRPNEYQPGPAQGIEIYDRFRPAQTTAANAIYIEPPAANSPVRIKAVKQGAQVRWRTDQFLAAGLRTKDTRIDSAQLFTPEANDIPVAEADGSPVILARPGKTKLAVFGFHPLRSALRFELATPLVFANIMRWMAPEIFQMVEVQAGSTGTVSVTLDSEQDPASIRIDSNDGAPLPFTVRGRTLRFFSGSSGTVRSYIADRELVHSLTLPDVAEAKWDAPKTIRTGLAGAGGPEASARDIWYWLAIAGAVLLLIEWLLFGRSKPETAVARLLRFPSGEPQRKAS